jgi:hypothetical protein
VERGALKPGDACAITCGEPMGYPERHQHAEGVPGGVICPSGLARPSIASGGPRIYARTPIRMTARAIGSVWLAPTLRRTHRGPTSASGAGS